MKNFFKTLGPGILFASTAIGVSHLVQSTRAGANFGFGLVWAVVISNVLKYPFFEYASRYANVTKTSIIDGYLKIGKWMLWVYFIITILTMFFVTSAVGVVTAGFMDNLFGISTTVKAMLDPDTFINPALITPVLIIVICGGILFFGKFGFLDSLVKIIGAVLFISTIVAFVMVLNKGPEPRLDNFVAPNVWDWTNVGTFGFIIALMGWMPTALDLSAWNSLWTLERIKQTKYVPKLRETQVDFMIGYGISGFLALCFITLGTYLMFGTGKTLSDKAPVFANQVVTMYTNSMGNWSYFLIAISAFTIMFGTFIAVLDGYSRSLERVIVLLTEHKTKKFTSSKKLFNISLVVLVGISFTIMYYFAYSPNSSPNGFKNLVDFATSASFIFAPIIAIVNFRLVQPKFIGKKASPKKVMRILSYIGIVFLLCFAIAKIGYLFL